MSWLSKALHLDNTPALKAINTAGNIGLAAVEANNPGLASTINTVTTVASDLGQVHTVSQVVAVVLELDANGVKNFELKAEAAMNKVLTDRGVSLLAEGELDAAFESVVTAAEDAATAAAS